MDKGLKNQSETTKNITLIRQDSVHTFSGPLPPPEILKRFDKVVPCTAERIIKMAEEQSAHRRELEKRVIDSDITR